MIDGYASERSYLDHIGPIWAALPEALRGEFYLYDPTHAEYAAMRGITVTRGRLPVTDRRIIVGGGRDLMKFPGRRFIFVEHGAGQTYVDAPGAAYGYAGGTNREGVELFICPAQRVADANLAVYPGARAVVVGSPRLDPWLDGTHTRVPGARPHVVVSTHWNGGPCQESHSAWPEYRRHYGNLAVGRVRVSKHGHPRWADHVRRDLPDVPFIEFDEVLETADVYVCDNSSTQYETAAVGIPNVVVNAHDYRRDVHHGLRFWSHIPGPQVDRPEQLAETVREVLADLDQWSDYARRVATDVYDGLLDGHATERAVDAIVRLDASSRAEVPVL